MFTRCHSFTFTRLLLAGKGKCDGATPELAWNYVADMTANKKGGMFNLNDVPYNGENEKCQGLIDNQTPVVGIQGWTLLPSNDYKATMNAVAKVGPVVLAVAASDWSLYESGIFKSKNDSFNISWNPLLRCVVVVNVCSHKVLIT